eukprot:2903148-Pleurochrysis_carterae.AAC.6
MERCPGKTRFVADHEDCQVQAQCSSSGVRTCLIWRTTKSIDAMYYDILAQICSANVYASFDIHSPLSVTASILSASLSAHRFQSQHVSGCFLLIHTPQEIH